MKSNPMNALNWLLHPVLTETFLTQHWNDNPLYIAGTAKKLGPLQFDRSVFMDLVKSIGGDAGHPALQATIRDAQGHFFKQNPKPADVDALYDAGHSIILRRLEEHSEALARLRASLKLNMNAVGNVRCDAYMTSGGGGLGIHFDEHHVFIIQLEGTKRWKFSTRPGVEAPVSPVSAARDEFISGYQTDNPWAQVRLPQDSGMQEVTLTPGDVLFMPPGTWHDGVADDYSLSVTTYVELRNPAEILLERLSKKIINQPDWRRHVPLPQPDEFNSLEVPASIHRFFETRLDEMRAELQTLSADELVNVWLSDVYSCDMPAPSTVRTDDTQPDDVLARTDAFPIRYSVVNDNGTPLMHLYLPDDQLTLPVAAQRLFDEIRRHDQFRACEAMDWTDGDASFAWDDVAPLLNLLIDSGVLTVVRG